MVASSNSDNRFGGGPGIQFGMDDPQPFSSSDVGQGVDTDQQAMDLDPEDNPPPPGVPN